MLSRMIYSLLNKLQVVEKLAESRPIRRAAQITAYAIIKAQLAGQDATRRVLRSQTLRQVRERDDLGHVGSRIKRVHETFMKEVKEGWKDGSKHAKK